MVREAEAPIGAAPSSLSLAPKIRRDTRALPLPRPLMAALAILGVAVAILGEETFLRRARQSFGHLQHPEIAVVDLAVGLAYILTGLVAWRRRPSNRVGPLMTAVGFAWFIGAWGNLSDWNVWRGAFGFVYDTGPKFDLFRVAYWFEALNQAILVHLILSFPTGRLGTRPARLVAAGAYLNVLILGFVRAATIDLLGGLGPLFHFPSGHLGLWPGAYSHLYVGRVYEGVWISLLVAALVILLVRWHRATRPMRRIMAPVWFAGSVVAVTLMVSAPALLGSVTSWQVGACCTGALAPTTTPLVLIPEGLQAALFWIVRTGQLLIPVAFLFGLLRVNLARIGVSDLIRRLGHPQPTDALQTVLSRALDDPSFNVAYWIPASRSFVDSDGHPVLLPEDLTTRAVTMIGDEGRTLGALIHDPALFEQPILLDAVASAARLSMENERLAAEVKAQLEEVRASRARIVETADVERRRIERDLHDGAQQRLVNLSLSLGLAQDRLASGDVAGASTVVHEAREDLRRALSELRELARGIHPAVLIESGLGWALESLAERSAVPAVLVDVPAARLPAPVEATAYFVASEALANVAKHAGASRVTVGASVSNGTLRVEIADDGHGGADPSKGTGLRGLADRIAAVDGRFLVDSDASRGTRVVAEIPCA